jgi:topoisomerase-4 subunit A
MAFFTLEKIFIREEMYIDFKLYSDREALYKYMYDRFEPFSQSFVRAIIDDDLQRFNANPDDTYYRFDSDKADDFTN